MTPKTLLKYLPDTDLRLVIREVLDWRDTGTRTGDALDRLSRMLVADCGGAADTDGLLQIAETLALAEAARRFAGQNSGAPITAVAPAAT